MTIIREEVATEILSDVNGGGGENDDGDISEADFSHDVVIDNIVIMSI